MSAFNPNDPIRFIATVDFTGAGEGGTADFSFQPLIAADCVADMGGLPVGEPFASNGVPVGADGTFQMTLNGTLPADANPVPALQCQELAAEIEVTGQIISADLSCGTVVVLGTIMGTFGAIRIPPGTVGDENLPAPLTACP